MKYKVDTTPNFEKEAAKLLNKYASLVQDIGKLIDQLEKNPHKGTHLGKGIYKIRIAIKSKGKGKHGGGRVMTHVKIKDQTVFMFSIYSKGDKDDISDDEIKELLKEIPD